MAHEPLKNKTRLQSEDGDVHKHGEAYKLIAACCICANAITKYST